MKSHHKYRFWLISLMVHLCIATVLSFIIINQITPSDVDALEVTILKVEPVPLVKKTPRIAIPPVVPTPTPNFQIEPQSASVQTRDFTTQLVRATSVSVPKAVAADASASQPRNSLQPPKFLSKADLNLLVPMTNPPSHSLLLSISPLNQMLR